MNKIILLLLAFAVSDLLAQQPVTPLEKNNYSRPTTYEELESYLQEAGNKPGLTETEIIARSVKGHNIYAVKFSSSHFGQDPSKIKVLIFAQQHGNEQGGKEGALMLINELLKPENRYLFAKIDLVIVPQMNPDGSEANSRRNGNGMDLNRNHLILTEPETIGLHKLFDKYLFEVSMDAHEYFPFGETWQKYGYRNNSDLLLGTTTNTNVSGKIRELSNKGYIPYERKYLASKGISNFIYSPGGPPEEDYIRHSTFDINDGRQSMGIQNTFSFIHEGLNGKDGFADNLKHRAESQMYGMKGLIEYACANSKTIKKLVAGEREKLINSGPCAVSIQSEHVRNGQKLNLPLLSYSTGKDTVVIVSDYRPIVKSICDVVKPEGYLVPLQSKDLSDWAERQGFTKETYKPAPGDRIERYQINALDSIDFEGDKTVNPTVEIKTTSQNINPADYIYLPTRQLKGDILVLALEPKSELGLMTYKKFSYLLKPGEEFPVLRVVRK